VSQRTLASDAADEAFKDGLKQVFSVLTQNLIAGDSDAESKAAEGIKLCQKTLDVFKGLIANLPN